ncbi:DUF413 domain-containing protein [Vibrio vulnificus]|uniref:DUF413 domain-containing protein n=1 Tax=Vibrio vulnificus TaxID=672 RepID=UPI00102A8F1E|nr:DUF413 domain-containing protein [Vibrio vulnificus]EGQ7928720.1 DUF413 domain-containing protein [Vibrio vulnificus]EGQ9968331.1 DUF413 domain-containing protein [Vibrio vulnificus]EGR0206886.1 DUF413 domain-containing protein [Vibrio vulnificus]EHV9834119.1 DUF413 domain-containing protein [Vibrio vulnificus]EIJ0942980.1 DUF413 domain-containing protein [Vibrio vulnificus]
MSDTTIRHGKKRFFDNAKFPRGFAKSGDFTLAEEEILMIYGDTLVGLETGQLTPENDDEKHFLLTLETPEAAQNKVERTWLKYMRLARGRKRFHTLNGRNKPDATDDYVEEDASLTEDD